MLRAWTLIIASSAPIACAGTHAPAQVATSGTPTSESAKGANDTLAAQRAIDDDGIHFRVEALARHENAGWEVDVTVRARPTDGGTHHLGPGKHALQLFARVRAGDADWVGGEKGGVSGHSSSVVAPGGEAVLARPWRYDKPIRAGDVLRLHVATGHRGTSQQQHRVSLAMIVLDLTEGKPPRLTVEAPLPDDVSP